MSLEREGHLNEHLHRLQYEVTNAESALIRLDTTLLLDHQITQEMAIKIAIFRIELDNERIKAQIDMNNLNRNSLANSKLIPYTEHYSDLIVAAFDGNFRGIRTATHYHAEYLQRKSSESQHPRLITKYEQLSARYHEIGDLVPDTAEPFAYDGFAAPYFDENLIDIFGAINISISPDD